MDYVLLGNDASPTYKNTIAAINASQIVDLLVAPVDDMVEYGWRSLARKSLS